MSDTHGEKKGGLAYAPGLDGLRALAVSFVVAYHIGTTSFQDVLPGGWLGVDVFFVLSGYLITSLLIVEVQGSGRISIKKFYIRRMRRLLPALYTMLLAVAFAGAFWLPSIAEKLKGDILASLLYVQNWWLIAQGTSYFSVPSMLNHLWSLAVEEQYYVLWPLILMGFAALRLRRGVMLGLVLAMVVASTVAGLMLYHPDTDPSRVYYGTDTRALAPLLGAAMAIAIRPWLHRTRLPRGTRVGLDTVGTIALLVLAGIAATLSDQAEFVYRGGFVVIAAVAAVAVAVAGHPDTGLGRALGTQPLKYLGERSYAIYLWHWPVLLVTQPEIDIPITGWANAALAIAITLTLAEISYHVIEKPIRKQGFLATLKAPKVAATAAVAAGRAAMGRAVSRTGNQPARGRITAPAPARPRGPMVRTALMSVLLVAGGTTAGFGLVNAANEANKPVDFGAPPTFGAPTVSAGPAAPYRTYLARGATVSVAGDSVGQQLADGNFSGRRPPWVNDYLNVENGTKEGCGFLLARVHSPLQGASDSKAWCSVWKDEYVAKVPTPPELVLVVTGAWDTFDLTLPTDEKVAFGSPGWDQYYTTMTKDAIDFLRTERANTPRPVGLVLLACFRPTIGHKGNGEGYWGERGDDTRTRHINDLLQTIAASYGTGVFTIDPPEQFCTDAKDADGHAYATDEGVYRFDGVHPFGKGSTLYWQKMLPQIMDPTALVDANASPTPGASA